MAIVSLPPPRPARRAPTTDARAQRALVLACALLCAGAVTAFAPAAHAQAAVPDARTRATRSWRPRRSTARGLALGTGLRASAISTSALAYSPAALALGNLYHIEANIDYISALNTVALGAAAVDSSTSKLGAGISLRGFLSGDDGYNTDAGYDYDGIDGRVGLALALSRCFFARRVGALHQHLERAGPGRRRRRGARRGGRPRERLHDGCIAAHHAGGRAAARCRRRSTSSIATRC